MSHFVVEPGSLWDRIRNDPELSNARRKLSIHEMRLIIKHALSERRDEMTDHKGLPVSGYAPQSEDKIAFVNVNKALEERVLRQLDLMRTNAAFDQRMINFAFTGVQDAFMWANRAVFQPTRVSLPEDTKPTEPNE